MSELGEFQRAVARRWRERATATNDLFAQFFFLFAAFNALYFLWAELDRPLNSEGAPAGEPGQIDHLVKKVQAAPQLARALANEVEYFSARSPIQRMDRRLSGSTGSIDDGRRWQRKLRSEPAAEQIRALARIVYLIRCNLVHGSKIDSGDDEELIVHAIPVLRYLVEACFEESLNA